MKNNYKPTIIICSIIASLLIGVTVIFALSDKKEKTPAAPTPAPTPAEDEILTEEGELLNEADGIITAIDLDSSSLTLRTHSRDEEFTFTFTGATDIRTRSQRVISARLLKTGDFVKAFYNDDGRLIKLYGSDTVWTYKNVGNLQIDPTLKKMTIGSTIYRYDDSLKILDSGDFTELDSITGNDILNLYGIDNYIYLIKIAKGHGYLSFANDSDFIGGSLSYNPGKTIQLTENLKLELAEGDYSITVKNAEYLAKADIRISPHSTTKFDLFDYGAKPVEYGTVHFDIEPKASDLFIDGVKTNFSEPVKLTYGDHEIEVSLGGYTSYHGNMTIDRTDISKSISLSVAPDMEDEDEDILYEDTAEATPTPTLLPDSGSDAADSSSEVSDSSGSGTDDSIDNIPDSTTDDGDMDNIEVIDGDSDDTSPLPAGSTGGDGSANSTDTSGSDNTDNSTDTSGSDSTDGSTDTSGSDSTDGSTDSSGSDNADTPDNTDGTHDTQASDSPDSGTEVSGSDNTDSSGNTDENNDSDGSDTTVYHGTFTIYCTNGTAVFVDDVYSGEIEGGSITLPKPSGIVEIRLTKEGYVTKKYTLTMDDDEAEQAFTFPDMTKSS